MTTENDKIASVTNDDESAANYVAMSACEEGSRKLLEALRKYHPERDPERRKKS